LNRRPIGHRIGERHSQLDHIRAAFHQRIQIGGGITIPGGDEADEGRAALGEGRGETLTHSFAPSDSATVKMSLSPRPETFTRMRWSLPYSFASFGRTASAWALSSAGMIPSSLQQSWKASSASSSVMGMYFTRPL